MVKGLTPKFGCSSMLILITSSFFYPMLSILFKESYVHILSASVLRLLMKSSSGYPKLSESSSI